MNQSLLPPSAVAFGFNGAGDAVAVNADGAQTLLESAESMDAQIVRSGLVAKPGNGYSTQGAGEDKGVLSGIAASIAGAGGALATYMGW